MVTAIHTHAASLLPAHKQWSWFGTTNLTRYAGYDQMELSSAYHGPSSPDHTDKRHDWTSLSHLLPKDAFYTSQLQTGQTLWTNPARIRRGIFNNEPGEAPQN